jgi:2-polyprenyl-3-methyl-5-hydroxy-6-metoxy-1,4-benzoquinol methylase
MGCGNGAIANALIRKGYNIIGIDASESGIEIANHTNPGHFFIQDLSNNGLPKEIQDIKFDTIISTEVIEHLYAPRIFINNCKSILHKRGTLIISTPYHGYLKNLLLALAGAMDRHFTALWDGGHIKFWSRKTLTNLLEEQGFTIEKFIGAGRIPYLWKSMIIQATI